MSNLKIEIPNLSEIRHEAAERRRHMFREAVSNLTQRILSTNTTRVVNAVQNNVDQIYVTILPNDESTHEWINALRKQRATVTILTEKESVEAAKSNGLAISAKVAAEGLEDTLKFRIARIRLDEAGRTPIKATKPSANTAPTVITAKKIVR